MIDQSKARNDASLLASELIGQMWTSSSSPQTFDTTPEYADWASRVATQLPAGDFVLTPSTDGKAVDIEINWYDKKIAARSKYVTRAEINRNQ